jgi:hypothetical protein
MEHVRIVRLHESAARCADDAERDPDHRGDHQAGDRENRRVCRSLGYEVAYRPVVE